MKRLLTQLASLSLVGILAGAPTTAVGAEGKWFGGVDTGVVVPLNAMNRYTSEGGMIAPFFGYMFFPDKDLTLNLGLQAQGQFLGLPQDTCGWCRRTGAGDEDTYALAYHAGPRLELPIGPVQLYGTYQLGGLSGLTSPSAITDTSWGMSTGGGINYKLNDNVLIGAFGRWNRWYQKSHHVGDVRYAVGGIGVTLQSAPPPPPPPPPPVAQAPPPPPPPAKKKIVLRGVNFDFDKSDIRPDARPILDEACSILKQEGAIDVVCKGHTDSVGSDAYNQRLSERRAKAVRDYLVKCGIAASRITAKGFGESNPAATNANAEGRAQNRRTELQILGQ